MSRYNNAGFTLLEVVVAMVILMVGMMALLSAVTSAMSYNLDNMLRDEAVQVADARLRQVKANKSATYDSPFSNLSTSVTRTSKLRSQNNAYVVSLASSTTGGSASRMVTVNVQWNYKGRTKQHELKTFTTY